MYLLAVISFVILKIQKSEAALLRLVSTEGGESQTLVTLDKQTKDFVSNKAREIQSTLDGLPSDDLKVATLVTILSAYLRPQASKEDRAADKVA